MTPTSARCLFLPWDSEFFGIPIARVVSPSLDSAQLQASLNWCHAQKISCLYWLADATEANARLADQGGFRKVDDRVVMRRLFTGREALEGSDPRIRLCEPDDVASLKRIAIACHADSRFHRDHGFDSGRATNLFETWVVHDCAGAAEAVFVARVEQQPVGYMTCHVRPGNQGEIGLCAIDPAHRRLGLGTALLQRGLRYFAQRGIGEARVVLSGRNQDATRLLVRHSFTPISAQWWFHRWFTAPAMVA